MSYSKQKSTGRRYTAAVALVLAGAVVSPIALYVARPVDYVSVSLAAAFTLMCLMSAWFQWKKRSRLSIVSLPLRFRPGDVLKALLLCFALSASISRAAGLPSYRGFEFGSSVAMISERAGLLPKDAKVLHKQPALIQTMDWQPLYVVRADGKTDSVREGTFSFLNGQLYRIVVIYDRYRLEGMTSEDVIAALSKTYGPASHPAVQIPFHSFYSDTAKVLARWEDATGVYDLVPTEDKASFALVLSSKHLSAAADAAIVEAVRLDAIDAPQRAKDDEQKRLEIDRLALEKARDVSKSTFIP